MHVRLRAEAERTSGRDRPGLKHLDRRQAHQLPCLVHGASKPLFVVAPLDRDHRALVLLVGRQRACTPYSK